MADSDCCRLTASTLVLSLQVETVVCGSSASTAQPNARRRIMPTRESRCISHACRATTALEAALPSATILPAATTRATAPRNKFKTRAKRSRSRTTMSRRLPRSWLAAGTRSALPEGHAPLYCRPTAPRPSWTAVLRKKSLCPWLFNGRWSPPASSFTTCAPRSPRLPACRVFYPLAWSMLTKCCLASC